MKKIFLIPLLFIGGRFIYNKFLLSNKLQIIPANFRVGGSFTQPKLILTLTLINPTNGTARVSNVSGSIFLANGTFLASVNLQTSVVIPANNRVNLDLEIVGVNSTLINVLTNLISNKNLTIKFDGFITADGLRFPLQFDKKFL